MRLLTLHLHSFFKVSVGKQGRVLYELKMVVSRKPGFYVYNVMCGWLRSCGAAWTKADASLQLTVRRDGCTRHMAPP